MSRFGSLFAWLLVLVFTVEFGLLPPAFARNASRVVEDEDEDYEDEDEEEDEEEEEESAEEAEAPAALKRPGPRTSKQAAPPEDEDEDEDMEEDEEEEPAEDEDAAATPKAEDEDEDMADDEEESPSPKKTAAPIAPAPAKSRPARIERPASPVAIVLVPSEERNARAGGEAEKAAYDWFRRQGLDTFDILTALGGKLRAKPTKNFAQAGELYQEADKLYQDNQFDRAVEQGTKAVDLLKPILTYEGAVALLVQTYVLIGVCQVMNLDDEQGKASFKQAMALDSRVQLDSRFQDDMVRDAFTASRTEIESAGAGALTIETDPELAQVYLDGNFRGLAPLTLKNVTPGTHSLMVVATGYWIGVKDVEMAAGADKATAKVKLQEAADYPRYRALMTELGSNFEHPRLYSPVRKLSRMMDAEHLLLLKMSRRGQDYVLTAYLYNLSEKQFKTKRISILSGMPIKNETEVLLEGLMSRDTAWADVGAAESGKGAAMASSAEPDDTDDDGAGAVPAATAKKKKDAEKGGTAFYKTWWFWTIIGVAVAGAGAGVGTWLYLRSQDEGSGDATIIVDF